MLVWKEEYDGHPATSRAAAEEAGSAGSEAATSAAGTEALAHAPQPETQEPAQITLPAAKTSPPRPPAKRRASPAAPLPTAPPSAPPAEQAPAQPSPPPQLGEILSNVQRRQYEAEYAQSLSRARSALQQASGKSLSAAQRETVARIATFLQQAEESKGKDLATALQLVRRADVLGQDLVKDFP